MLIDLPAFFDLRGPQFLVLYGVMFGGAMIVGLIMRYFMRGPSDYDQLAAGRLDPYDVAYLQGGPPRAYQAALTSLLQKGVIHIMGDAVSVVYGEGSRRRDVEHPLEQEIVRQVDTQKVGRLGDLFGACAPAFDKMHEKLLRMGMLLSKNSIWSIRILMMSLYLVVAAVGAIKIWVGISRDKPVGFLIAFVIATVLIALLCLAGQFFRTSRADTTLSKLRKKSESLKAVVKSGGSSLSGNDLALGVALFGVAAIPAMYPDLNDWVKRNRSGDGGGSSSYGGGDSSGSCGSGGSSSSDSGGGGGGCGGCGGGGGGD
ncbi:MAG: TIGR04222 domain-containing membrane protein [Candidatus Sumerlaeaceae bacterium]